jgi:hypothetical protein
MYGMLRYNITNSVCHFPEFLCFVNTLCNPTTICNYYTLMIPRDQLTIHNSEYKTKLRLFLGEK